MEVEHNRVGLRHADGAEHERKRVRFWRMDWAGRWVVATGADGAKRYDSLAFVLRMT